MTLGWSCKVSGKAARLAGQDNTRSLVSLRCSRRRSFPADRVGSSFDTQVRFLSSEDLRPRGGRGGAEGEERGAGLEVPRKRSFPFGVRRLRRRIGLACDRLIPTG
jgi:hypothetical protein